MAAEREEERETRLKPAAPLPEAGPEDEAARATVLVSESERQTRLKPAEPAATEPTELPFEDEISDANRATRLASRRPADQTPDPGDEPRHTKAKKG